MEDIIILGIESSSDDTSAAVIRNGELLSNVTASQAVHESYGGVVPELASRAHELNIVPVVDQAIKKAGIDSSASAAEICGALTELFASGNLTYSGLTGENMTWSNTGEVTKDPKGMIIKNGVYEPMDS
jgi:hypothetical protein